MWLGQLLVACAETVACRDRAQVAAPLCELQGGAPVHSTTYSSASRRASCRGWQTDGTGAPAHRARSYRGATPARAPARSRCPPAR